MKKGQIDGAASGQMACERLAPTLRVSRLPGVFQDRDEAETVLSRLRPLIDQEAHTAGFTILAITGLGPEHLLHPQPGAHAGGAAQNQALALERRRGGRRDLPRDGVQRDDAATL